MKNTLALILILISFSALQAQYTINDAAFAAKLLQIVPNAMTGNVLDETHPDVTGLQVMNVSFSTITDLDGIQFFTGLTELWCENNMISNIPSLPPGLQQLICYQNELTSLPSLPASIISIIATHNNLATLPNLPTGLQFLSVHENPGIVLPALPNSLIDLRVHYCDLYDLPTLPTSLEYLGCGWNNLTTLPPLPPNLFGLYCSANDLISLPAMPASLNELYCDHNQLSTFPTLPNSLGWLIADHNQLTSIPTLPPFMTEMVLNNNQISALPMLPSNLNRLEIRDNLLQSVPALPPSIKFLHVDSNQLSSIPALPASLDHLYCGFNQILSLPTLNAGLKRLSVENDPIDCLPWLPSSLQQIYCDGTNITCIPNIPASLTTNDCALAVCNINGAPCPMLDEAVSGTVFHDDNGDGILDIGEPGFTNAVIEAIPGSFLTIPDTSGNYVMPLDTGSYTLDGMEVLYHLKTTLPHSITLGLLEVDTLKHVGYQAIPGIYDLVVDVSSAPARPGFNNAVWLNVDNIGTEVATAAIDLTFDMDQTWLSSDSMPDSQVGNAASWSAILAPGEFWQNRVVLSTDVAVPLGTPIQHILNAIPQLPDTTPLNNVDTLNKVVIGSFDPNNKLNDPSAMLPLQVMNGEYIEYTINFQNTGTYHAERVVITDTLSADLDWSSMEYISGSHENIWYLQNGVLHFVHDPIFLPDSNANEPESHGYVKFRMKPVSTLMIGEQIENIANIYFDFNEPIITDPAIFSVSIPTEISELENANFEMYPNPTNGNVTIMANDHIEQIELLQLDGRMVRSVSVNNSRSELDLSELANGVYVVHVIYANEQSSSQLLMVE